MAEFSRRELMPGVFLTCIQTKKFKSSYWSLRMATPLEEKTAAMNALLPRVLRRGTVSCPNQKQLSSLLDELYGGVIEPTATKRGEVQCFGFSGTFLDDGLVPDGTPLLDRAARLMGDLLLHPATRNGRLMGGYVDSERRNLIAEIRGEINDKRQYATKRLIQEMCSDEAYGVPRLGTLELAEKINVQRLNSYYHQLLPVVRLEVYYCGSAEPRRVEQAWREALMDLPRGRVMETPYTQWRAQVGEVRRITDHMDVTQGKLVMGFRTGTTLAGRLYPAAVVANALFGGTPTSKLFMNVREKLSLCYYASSALDKHKGVMLIQSGVSFADFDRAEQEILAQLEAVRRGDFTEEELDAAKKSVASAYRTAQDSQALQEDYWLSQSMAEIQISPAELAALLEEVTREQVIEAVQSWQLDCVYCLKGPEEGEGKA